MSDRNNLDEDYISESFDNPNSDDDMDYQGGSKNSKNDEEKQPLNKADKKNKNSGSFSGGKRKGSVKMEEDEDYPITDENYGSVCTDKWEGDKWIWNQKDLEIENNERSGNNQIACIKRMPYEEVESKDCYGIRANPRFPENYGWLLSLKSFYVPWHNEFISIWVYLAFAIYFWVETFMIMAHNHQYVFIKQHDYDFMFIATLGYAVSLTITCVFLVFYSMSEEWYTFFEFMNYIGYLFMIFSFTFAFIGSELIGTDAYFPLLFLLVFVFILNLMLAQYDFGRIISLFITIGTLTFVYAYDFIFYSNSREKEVFYIPILIEGALLAFGYALYYYQVPERWCRGVKFFQLYLTGFHFFTLFLINFYFETSFILYYTLKQNSGNYDGDTDNWYQMANIFKK